MLHRINHTWMVNSRGFAYNMSHIQKICYGEFYGEWEVFASFNNEDTPTVISTCSSQEEAKDIIKKILDQMSS